MQANSQKPVLCLFGPTAVGKSALAVQIAEALPSDIISVDSALIYRGMDIGTAKPSLALRAQIPHALIDIRDPSEAYSAADFCADVDPLIQRSHQANRLPLLVGGTMLYFKALQQGLSPLPAADKEVRAALDAEAAKVGWAALHDRLQRIDPISAARIHPHDPQRLQRALEVYELTGQSLSALQSTPQKKLAYRFLNIGLTLDRHLLHERIAERFNRMLAEGFIEEMRTLYERGDLMPNLPSMRSVGYRQGWRYFTREYTYDEMREKAIIATRQLAKRQLTWLRHWPHLDLFDAQTFELSGLVLHHLESRL